MKRGLWLGVCVISGCGDVDAVTCERQGDLIVVTGSASAVDSDFQGGIGYYYQEVRCHVYGLNLKKLASGTGSVTYETDVDNDSTASGTYSCSVAGVPTAIDAFYCAAELQGAVTDTPSTRDVLAVPEAT